MENNVSNKAKFFALYWLQSVYCHPTRRNGHFMELGFKKVEKAWLKLKPLMSITDEDATEVGNILCITDIVSVIEREKNLVRIGDEKANYIASIWIDGDILCASTDMDENRTLELSGNCLLAAYDYLRSKGYAVPFMDIPVDTLVEWGWIKLSN